MAGNSCSTVLSSIEINTRVIVPVWISFVHDSKGISVFVGAHCDMGHQSPTGFAMDCRRKSMNRGVISLCCRTGDSNLGLTVSF